MGLALAGRHVSRTGATAGGMKNRIRWGRATIGLLLPRCALLLRRSWTEACQGGFRRDVCRLPFDHLDSFDSQRAVRVVVLDGAGEQVGAGRGEQVAVFGIGGMEKDRFEHARHVLD